MSFKNRKRDKLEIALSILQAAKEPVRKTRIIYKANLNFMQLNRYLEFLERCELIEYVDSGKVKSTERGLRAASLLEALNNADQALED